MNLYNMLDQERFLKKNISLYLLSGDAEELLDEICGSKDEYIENFKYHEEILDDSDIVVVSRVRNLDGWFIEPLYYDDENQIINETDICFIQEEILDEIDLGRVDYEELVVVKIDAEEDDWLEKLTYDLINELSEMGENECIHCIVKKYLKMVEEITKDCTLDDVVDKISNL